MRWREGGRGGGREGGRAEPSETARTGPPSPIFATHDPCSAPCILVPAPAPAGVDRSWRGGPRRGSTTWRRTPRPASSSRHPLGGRGSCPNPRRRSRDRRPTCQARRRGPARRTTCSDEAIAASSSGSSLSRLIRVRLSAVLGPSMAWYCAGHTESSHASQGRASGRRRAPETSGAGECAHRGRVKGDLARRGHGLAHRPPLMRIQEPAVAQTHPDQPFYTESG